MTTMPKEFTAFETRGAKDADPATAALVEDIGRARGTDYFLMKDQLTDHELEIMGKVRAFRRGRGAAERQRVLGARRVPVRADPENRRAGTSSATTTWAIMGALR